jgi:hypothetical protein
MDKIYITSYICALFNIFGVPLLIALLLCPVLKWYCILLYYILSFVFIWILTLNVNPYSLDMNKSKILDFIPERYRTKHIILNSLENVRTVQQSFTFPVVVKPIVCTALSRDIRVVNDRNDRKNLRLLNNFMAQEYFNGNIEIGVLYEMGKVIGIVEKVSKQNIRADCHSGDIVCRERKDLLVAPVAKACVAMSKGIPNFNVGRYDIKMDDNGNFKVLEVNGTMGFDIRASVGGIIQNIYYSERWFFKRLLIGLINIILLKGYSPINLVKAMMLTIRNTVKCRDWEKFYAVYS